MFYYGATLFLYFSLQLLRTTTLLHLLSLLVGESDMVMAFRGDRLDLGGGWVGFYRGDRLDLGGSWRYGVIESSCRRPWSRMNSSNWIKKVKTKIANLSSVMEQTVHLLMLFSWNVNDLIIKLYVVVVAFVVVLHWVHKCNEETSLIFCIIS